MGVIQATTLPACGHSRTSSVGTKLIIDGGAGNNGRDAAKTQNETVENHIVLGRGFSDFLVFRLTCEGPASATVCAGSA